MMHLTFIRTWINLTSSKKHALPPISLEFRKNYLTEFVHPYNGGKNTCLKSFCKDQKINFKNLANSACLPHCDLFIILTLDFLCFFLIMRNARHKRRAILSQCSQDFDVSALFSSLILRISCNLVSLFKALISFALNLNLVTANGELNILKEEVQREAKNRILGVQS